MKTKIIYEDEYVIVVDKPAGMAVQTKSFTQADVESELRKYVKGKDRKADIFVVHRLDQPVSGLCVFARDKKSADFLSKQLNDGRMKKTYTATVIKAEDNGPDLLEKGEGTLTDMLYKDSATNTSRVVEPEEPEYKEAKEAILDYKVIDTESDMFPKRGQLEINLHTGRHHQIRVQLSHAGMPIEGDTKYGSKESGDNATGRDARSISLRASRLEFVHPKSLDTVTFLC